MNAIADKLSSIPFFKEIARAEIEATARFWSPARLRANERLWQQGSPAYEIAVLMTGELTACYDGVEVGTIRPGELLGEVSAFILGGRRSATVTATEDCQILRLPNSALRTLRLEGSGVYQTLLLQALQVLARRIRLTDRRIAQLTSGTVNAPTRTEPSRLRRWWRSLRSTHPRSECPSLENILRRQPGLQSASDEAIQVLAKAFQPQSVEENEVIFLEGEQGAAGYIVAEGKVEVLRHVRASRAELLATLNPDDQFGMNTLVESGARTASCVAATPGWLYRMDAADFHRLEGEARTLWYENILASLATQIRNANASLRRAKQALPVKPGETPVPTTPRPEEPVEEAPGEPPDDSFRELLRASGFVEALPLSEKHLDKVQVISTEDQKRSPHLKKN